MLRVILYIICIYVFYLFKLSITIILLDYLSSFNKHIFASLYAVDSWVSKDGWDILSTFREVSAMLRSNEENSGSSVVGQVLGVQVTAENGN